MEVIVGAALDTLPTLADREEPFDLIFIDADKENNVAYVEWAIKLGAPGAVIVVDNIARSGRVLEPADDDHQARAVRDMLEMMGANPRLDAAAIQTVGTKGWDGFAVAVVKGACRVMFGMTSTYGGEPPGRSTRGLVIFDTNRPISFRAPVNQLMTTP